MIWIVAGLSVLIVIIFIIVNIKDNKNRKTNQIMQAPLTDGNVSVFMDNNGKIDVIPFNFNKLKQGRASDFPLTIMKPYTQDDVGALIREGLKLSGSEKSLSSKVLMEALGFFDWKDYSKGRKSVSLTCKKQEIAFNSTIRRSDGSYAFRVRGFEKVLPAKLSNYELGNEVLNMIKLSI